MKSYNIRTLSQNIFTSKWVGLFFLLLLYGLFLWIFYPAYETNDDSIMQGIAAGTFNSQNSEASLFTHFLYGYLVKTFYLWFPNFNWYGIFLIFFHIGSVFLVSNHFSKSIKNYGQVLVGMMLIFTFSFYFLLKLQFTSTAFIVCAAGVIFLLEFFQTNQKRTQYFLISFILFFLGSLIRWDAFIATILFSMVPLLFYFWKKKTDKAIWGYMSFYLILFLLPITQYYYYETYLDSDYQKYQRTAHQILDYNFELDSANLNELEWSENDLHLFQTYFRADTIFSLQQLEKLKEYISPDWDFISSIEIVFNLSKSFLFTSICLILLLIYCILSKEKMKYRMVLFFIVMHIGFVLLAAHFKLPLRVYLPCLFLFALIIYHQILKEDLKVVQKKLLSYACIICILTICILQTNIHWNIQNQNRQRKNEFENLKNGVEKYTNVFLVFVDCPLVYFQFPVLQTMDYKGQTQIFPLATFTWSPAYEFILDKYEIENFTSDLWKKEVIFVSSDENFFNYYRIFLLEHYQIEIDFDEVEALPLAKKIVWKN